jgi:catechol 2,3-dioxygenase-like lactoylglutathione lyase family enzyme
VSVVPGFRGVHHVAVSVPDIEVARRFYIDLPGAAGKQFMARLLDGAA